MTVALLTLEAWIAANYAEPRPSLLTVRRWVREGKIYPAPKKHGRSYRFAPNAAFVTRETLADRLKHGKQAA